MNRRKSNSSLGFPSLVLLVIAVMIVSSSGIGYVVMKNRQITIRGKIAEVQKKMDAHDVAILQWESDIETSLGIYDLRDHLADTGSALVPIKDPEPLLVPEDKTPPGNSMARR